MIHCTCPDCGETFRLPDRQAGRLYRCDECSANFRIPEKLDASKKHLPPSLPLRVWGFTAGIVMLLLVFGVWIITSPRPAEKPPAKPQAAQNVQRPVEVIKQVPEPQIEKPWYEQGTLQSASPEQWLKADMENRFRTCGFWIVERHRFHNKQLDLSKLRGMAKNLELLLTMAINDIPKENQFDLVRDSANKCLDIVLQQ